jgi:hypothetical protein
MTNSWQEHRSASFRFQPIQLHQPAKVLLALPSFGSASSLPPTPEVLRQHPAAQRLVIDHNPIFISQVLGG